MATRTQIQTLFLSYYGRPADPAAIAGFKPIGEQQIVPTLVGKVPYDASASSSNAEWIYDSVEPFRLETISQDLSGYITQIYGYLFDRLPGQVEIDNWVGALNDGLVNIDYLPLTIANAALNFNGSSNPAAQAMADVVLRKIEAADAFTAAIADGNQGLYASWLAIDVGQQFNASINADSSDADIAEAVGFAFTRLQPAGVNVEISLAGTTVAEGAVTGFALTGFGPDAAGSTYDYVLVGSEGFGVGDLVNGSLTGVVTLDSNGAGVVQIEIANDGVDPGESFVVNVSAAPGIVISSEAVTIVDGPAPAPSIAVNAAQTAVNEGGTMVFDILTTNVDEGASVNYILSGVDSADVNNAPLFGSVSVDANGLARVVFLVSEDLSFEGAETATLTASTGLGGVSDSASVVINDTSVPVVKSLQVQAGSQSATEGDRLEFVITTTGLEPGTEVAYALTGVDSADVNNANLVGTVQVDSAGLAFIGYEVSAELTFNGTKFATLTADAVGVDPASATTVISNELETVAVLTLNQDLIDAPAVDNFTIVGTSDNGVSTLGQFDNIDGSAAGLSVLAMGVAGDFNLVNWQTFNVDDFAIFANNEIGDGFVEMSGAGRLDGFGVDPDAAFGLIGVYQSDYISIFFSNIQSAARGGVPLQIELDDVATFFDFNFDANALVGDQDVVSISLSESPIDGEFAFFPDFASGIEFSQGPFNEDAGIEALILESTGPSDNALQQLRVGHSLLALTIFGDANLDLIGDLGVQPDFEFFDGYLSNDNHLLELIDARGLNANLHLDYTSHVGNEGNSRDENLVEVFGARGENNLFLDADGTPTNFNVLIANQISGRADDTVVTGYGDDTIVTDGGDDFVESYGGNNSISTETGDDTVETGLGNDTINTGIGDDVVESLGGDNLIDLGPGNDQAYTGDGDDTVFGRSGDNIICVENGDNRVFADDGNNEIGAGRGDDLIVVGDGNNTINAGSGDNDVFAGNGNNAINATFGDDDIRVGNGDNTIAAGAGNNTVITGSGSDAIQVGEGQQLLIAGYGDDNFFMTLDDLNSGDSISGDEEAIFDDANGRDVLNFIEGGRLGVSEQAGVRNVEEYALHNFAVGFGIFNKVVCDELVSSIEDTNVEDYHIVLSNSVVAKSDDIEMFNLLDDVQRFTVNAAVNNNPFGFGSAVTLDLTELEPTGNNAFGLRTGITYLGQDDLIFIDTPAGIVERVIQGNDLELILVNEPMLSETLEIDFGFEDVVVFDCSFPDAGQRITPIGLQTNFIQLELQESTYVVTQEDLANIANSDRFILSAAKAIASGSIIQAPTFSIELTKDFLEAQMAKTTIGGVDFYEDFVITPDGSLFSGIEGTVLELFIDPDAPFNVPFTPNTEGGRLIVETSGNFEVNYFDLNTREPIAFADLPDYVNQQSVLFFTDNFDNLVGNDCDNEFFAFKNTDLESKDEADGRGGFDTANFEFGTAGADLALEVDVLFENRATLICREFNRCFGDYRFAFNSQYIDADVTGFALEADTLWNELNNVSIQNVEEYVFDPFNQDGVNFAGFGLNEFVREDSMLGQLDLGSLDILRTAPANGSDFQADVNPNSGDDTLYIDDIFNVTIDGIASHVGSLAEAARLTDTLPEALELVDDRYYEITTARGNTYSAFWDLQTYTEDGDDIVLAGELNGALDSERFGDYPTYGQLGVNYVNAGEGDNIVLISGVDVEIGEFISAATQLVEVGDDDNFVAIQIPFDDNKGPEAELDNLVIIEAGDGNNALFAEGDHVTVIAGNGSNAIEAYAHYTEDDADNGRYQFSLDVQAGNGGNDIEYSIALDKVVGQFDRPFFVTSDGNFEADAADFEAQLITGTGDDVVTESRDSFNLTDFDPDNDERFNNERPWTALQDFGGNNQMSLRGDYNHYVQFFGDGDNDLLIRGVDLDEALIGGEQIAYFYGDGDNFVGHEGFGYTRTGFTGNGDNTVVVESGESNIAFLGEIGDNLAVFCEDDSFGTSLFAQSDQPTGGYFDGVYGNASEFSTTTVAFRISTDTDLAPWIVQLENEEPFGFDNFLLGAIGNIPGFPEDRNAAMSYVDQLNVAYTADDTTLRLANTVAAQQGGGLGMNDAGVIEVMADAGPDMPLLGANYRSAVGDTILTAADTDRRTGTTLPYFNSQQVLNATLCNFITEFDCIPVPYPTQGVGAAGALSDSSANWIPTELTVFDASSSQVESAEGFAVFNPDSETAYVAAYGEPKASTSLQSLIQLSQIELLTGNLNAIERQNVREFSNWTSTLDVFIPTPCFDNEPGQVDERRALQAETLNALVRGIFFEDRAPFLPDNQDEGEFYNGDLANFGAGAIGGSAADTFTSKFELAYPGRIGGPNPTGPVQTGAISGSFGFVSYQGNGGGDTFYLQNNDLLDSEQNIEFPFNDQYVELIRYTTTKDGSAAGGATPFADGFDQVFNFDKGDIFFSDILNDPETIYSNVKTIPGDTVNPLEFLNQYIYDDLLVNVRNPFESIITTDGAGNSIIVDYLDLNRPLEPSPAYAITDITGDKIVIEGSLAENGMTGNNGNFVIDSFAVNTGVNFSTQEALFLTNELGGSDTDILNYAYVADQMNNLAGGLTAALNDGGLVVVQGDSTSAVWFFVNENQEFDAIGAAPEQAKAEVSELQLLSVVDVSNLYANDFLVRPNAITDPLTVGYSGVDFETGFENTSFKNTVVEIPGVFPGPLPLLSTLV